MSDCFPLKPLDLAKSVGVAQREIALRLGITPDWLRRLGDNPRHARRIRIAVFEAALEQEQTALTVDRLMAEVGL